MGCCISEDWFSFLLWILLFPKWEGTEFSLPIKCWILGTALLQCGSGKCLSKPAAKESLGLKLGTDWGFLACQAELIKGDDCSPWCRTPSVDGIPLGTGDIPLGLGSIPLGTADTEDVYGLGCDVRTGGLKVGCGCFICKSGLLNTEDGGAWTLLIIGTDGDVNGWWIGPATLLKEVEVDDWRNPCIGDGGFVTGGE